MVPWRCLCGPLLLLAGRLSAEPLVTESLAGNPHSLADEDGLKEGWIEIHNPDNAPVKMEGWALTDNVSQLRKWGFPAKFIPAENRKPPVSNAWFPLLKVFPRRRWCRCRRSP